MLDEGMESDNHADICIANTLQSPPLICPHLTPSPDLHPRGGGRIHSGVERLGLWENNMMDSGVGVESRGRKGLGGIG